jgi:hypothetical protein
MKLSEIMKRSNFIRGNSKAIFCVNYSDVATIGDMVDIDNYIGTIIEKMPKKSMLLLLDVRRLKADGDTYGQLQEMFERYSSYFKSSAVVADRDNAAGMKNLINKLGFTKMQVHEDPELARKSLFSAS